MQRTGCSYRWILARRRPSSTQNVNAQGRDSQANCDNKRNGSMHKRY